MSAILDLCKLTPFPGSEKWRLFFLCSIGPNQQYKAKKQTVAICSRSNATFTGLGRPHAGTTFPGKWAIFGDQSRGNFCREILNKGYFWRCSWLIELYFSVIGPMYFHLAFMPNQWFWVRVSHALGEIGDKPIWPPHSHVSLRWRSVWSNLYFCELSELSLQHYLNLNQQLKTNL